MKYMIIIINAAFLIFFIQTCSSEKIQPQVILNFEEIIQNLAKKGAKIGCQIMDFKTGHILWSYKPDESLVPASNIKLITTAVSLLRLGPNYRFKTGIYITCLPVDGILQGDLYLKGFGDPFLVNEEMWNLTHELSLMGLKKITGNIITDDTFFDDPQTPEGLNEGKSSLWYDADVSALSFNFNTVCIYVQPGSEAGQKAIVRLDPDIPCLELKNDAITIKNGKKKFIRIKRLFAEGKNIICVQGRIPLGHARAKFYRSIKEPTIYTVMSFMRFLKRQGIECKGNWEEGKTPIDALPFYIHESKQLNRIIADINKDSSNFIAEQLLKTLAAEIEGPPGTYEKGVRIIKETLENSGIISCGLKLSDGSGLSPHNQIPVRLICDLLFYMAHSQEYGPEFVSSLAILGLDGTLKDRPLNCTISGVLRAKTGHIYGVSSLSGYLWTKHREPLIFSILMNGKQSQIDEFISSQNKIIFMLSN